MDDDSGPDTMPDDLMPDDTASPDDTAVRSPEPLRAAGYILTGAFSIALMVAWALPAIPAWVSSPPTLAAPPDLSSAPTVAAGGATTSSTPAAPEGDPVTTVATPTAPATSIAAATPIAGARGTAYQQIDATGRTISDMGCADDLTASSLEAFFANRAGPLVGWDNPHVYKVDENRSIWIAHDSYVDHDGSATNINDTRPQIQNIVFIQEGSCFTLVHGGTEQDWHNFERGDGHNNYLRFLWPLGGEVVGDRLWVFWAETLPSPNEPQFAGGARRHPEATWLASYDVETLERLSFEEAPNSGVFPQYGFAVESDDEYSYLFGNTNLLNLVREGGFDNGPHSATKMYLARVPFGQFRDEPVYWDGSGWADDPDAAATISERFWVENTMQPRLIEGRWVSVVKRDGFFGNEVVIDVAEAPQGPWIESSRIRYEPRASDVAKNSYQPIIAPWSGAENGLVIFISENAQVWGDAVDAIDVYRPAAFQLDWPFDEILATHGGGTRDDG